MGKKFYESKTVWLGILTLIVSVLTFMQGEEWVTQYPKIVSAVGTAIGVLTIVLRYLTENAMALTAKFRK